MCDIGEKRNGFYGVVVFLKLFRREHGKELVVIFWRGIFRENLSRILQRNVDKKHKILEVYFFYRK